MKFTLLMIVCLAIVLSVTSCSKKKEDIVVATIGEKEITLARFEQAYTNVDAAYLPRKSGFEGLREFLNTMIKKEVMVQQADKMGYDKDPTVVEGLKVFKKMGLQAAYLKFRVADKIKVTDEDLRERYNNMGVTLSVKQILVDTEDEAWEVHQILEEGNDFDSACKRYSKAPDAEEGGKVMTAAYGKFAPNFQDAVFSLKVGEYSKPIETTYGYFIVKVLRRDVTKQRSSFEEMREELEQTVRAYKEMAGAEQMSEEIRKQANFKWHDENIRTAFDALPPDRPLTNPPPKGSTEKPLLKIPESELEKPLVTYKDKAITLADFSELYETISFYGRPRREYRFGGIKKFLIDRIMNELIEEEMDRSNIEEEPEFKEALRNKKEELMLSRLYADMVDQKTNISDSDIREYYNANIESYKVAEKRRYGAILTGDQASAMEAYEKIQAGEDFVTVVMAYSIDNDTRARGGETEFLTVGEQPHLDEVGFSLRNIGDVSEPFQTSQGWVILKLIERSPERILPFEEAKGGVSADLRRLENDRRLNELLEEWKKEIPVVVYEENLRKADVESRVRE